MQRHTVLWRTYPSSAFSVKLNALRACGINDGGIVLVSSSSMTSLQYNAGASVSPLSGVGEAAGAIGGDTIGEAGGAIGGDTIGGGG